MVLEFKVPDEGVQFNGAILFGSSGSQQLSSVHVHWLQNTWKPPELREKVVPAAKDLLAELEAEELLPVKVVEPTVPSGNV